jgi:hypothetical protein
MIDELSMNMNVGIVVNDIKLSTNSINIRCKGAHLDHNNVIKCTKVCDISTGTTICGTRWMNRI